MQYGQWKIGQQTQQKKHQTIKLSSDATRIGKSGKSRQALLSLQTLMSARHWFGVWFGLWCAPTSSTSTVGSHA
jgi:hypothetical protein